MTWIFGYGSLMWNPGFSFLRKEVVRLDGWRLRFWQASIDHRGTDEYPGRVATLVPEKNGVVWGVAYLLEGDTKAVFEYLDRREQGGYERLHFEVKMPNGQELSVASYVGELSGQAFIGPEEEAETAAVISRAVGPSGRNRDYLERLHETLSVMGVMEPHVERLMALCSV